MKKFIVVLGIMILGMEWSVAQSKRADSVVVNVGNGSRITILIKDKKDLETMKHYNFQSLMNDVIMKLENQDTASAMKEPGAYRKETDEPSAKGKKEVDEDWKKGDDDRSDDKDSNHEIEVKTRSRNRGTRQSVSIDLGTNNYLTDQKFPDAGTDLHTVRPWGSWYLAANSVHRTRLARVFFLEWGLGASMYNFKFQNDAVAVSKTPSNVAFAVDMRDLDFKKSKLSAVYLNASFVPVLDFGGNRRKPIFFDGRRSESFRIGVGPYAAYLIGSYSRVVFKEDGEKEVEKNRDSFYLNNFRYGLRLQLGFKDTDLFFNYDLSGLFVTDKGPKLNAFSFGFSF